MVRIVSPTGSEHPEAKGLQRLMNVRVKIPGAFIKRTNLAGADLTKADLSRVNASYANFTDANFKDAILEGTKLQGAILTGARNLTLDQLRAAEVDETTVLPEGVSLEALTQESAA